MTDANFIVALELLGVCFVTAFGVAFFIVDVLMNPRLKCWRHGHKKFYYAGNSDSKWWVEGVTVDGKKQSQREHVYWCGRCGYESSDEKDAEKQRKYTVTNRGYLGLLLERYS